MQEKAICNRLHISTNRGPSSFAILSLVWMWSVGICPRQRRRSWGGGANIVLPPPPPIISTTFIICNARICIKSTIRHYKTIKFYIKILLNIHKFKFCGALCTQSFIVTLRVRAENFTIFLTLAPPIRKMDRRPWSSVDGAYTPTHTHSHTHPTYRLTTHYFTVFPHIGTLLTSSPFFCSRIIFPPALYLLLDQLASLLLVFI